MSRKSILLLTGVLIFVSIVLISCNKEANSTINFIFKPSTGTDLAAVIGDEKITNKDLIKGLEAEIHRREMEIYNLKLNKLKSMILEKLMAKDPRKKELSNDEFLKKYISKKGEPTASEIESFIKERNIPKEQINDQIKDRIKQYLDMENKKVAVDEWMAQVTKKTPIEVYFEKPQRPVFDVQVGEAPVKGNKDAKITIIEFTDFQCPYCKKGHETIAKVEKKYGNKVKIAIKHNPLPFHTTADEIANASFCALEQNEKTIWKFNDMAFEKAELLKEETSLNDELMKIAKSVGLNQEKFAECVKSNKHKAKIDKDMEESKDLQLNSVPMFFVNGQLLQGAQELEAFVEIIDEELAKI